MNSKEILDLDSFKEILKTSISEMSDEELLENFPGWIIKKEADEKNYDGDLWDADPDCLHILDPSCYSGIKCLKCGGWYCL